MRRKTGMLILKISVKLYCKSLRSLKSLSATNCMIKRRREAFEKWGISYESVKGDAEISKLFTDMLDYETICLWSRVIVALGEIEKQSFKKNGD